MPHRQLVVAQMRIIAKKVVAQRKAKRKNQKVANDTRPAHRVVTAVNQVIQAVLNRQVVANRHHHQVKLKIKSIKKLIRAVHNHDYHQYSFSHHIPL